jgi:hypothetical protein
MKLSASDAFVTAGAIAGSAMLLWAFSSDINSFTTRANLSPAGTVVFKRMSATRRPSDGLGWERMHNNGPVYDADTLRTAGFSEATVFFDDGTSLDLEENSMLRLNFGGATRNLEFLEGEITVGGGKAGAAYAISSSVGEIRVDKDSRATFSRAEDRVSVEVSEGSATLVRADGTTQSVAVNQELSVNLADGSSAIVSRPIIPIEPARNAKLLAIAPAKQANAEVSFEWKSDARASADAGASVDGKAASDAKAAGARYTLEISASDDFAGDVARFPVNGFAATVSLTEGTWYWRAIDETGEASPARKFTLATSAQCRPAYPADGAEYRYRRVRPEIRFAWTAMEEASSYLFELSADQSFDKPIKKTRVAATNLTIADLDGGTYYWRVSALHGFTETGAGGIAGARTVVVKKSGDMGKIETTTPFDGLLYQIQELDGKGLSFAWKPQEEAVSYEILVSKSKDLSNPLMTVPTNLPYAKLVGADCGQLAGTGKRYWGVKWIDAEGNRSPASASRELTGVDGSIAIRAVFPPDGYRVADSLAANARFSWKSNIAAKTFFVVARDADFSDVAYQRQVTSENALGQRLEPGMYWWKVRTMNADGSPFMETPARSFSVVGPLPGVALAEPSPGKPFYLRDGDSRQFRWQPVAGADYYSVALYSPKDGYAKPVYENGFAQGTDFTFALGDLPGGMYRLDVQAFALETDASTRVIGYIGESDVNYRRIEYLGLGAPTGGEAIDGLDARRNGVRFTYTAANQPDSSEFMLYGEGATQFEPERAIGSGNAWLRKRLAPGTYSWTVRGQLAGFDISSRETGTFEVLEIPPLPSAALVDPGQGTVIGAEQLRASRTIRFRWEPVAGANRYQLSVYKGEVLAVNAEKPEFALNMGNKTTFTMEDLSVLGKGTHTWIVRAESWDEANELEQTGIPARATFTIDLPEVRKATVNGGKSLYGR